MNVDYHVHTSFSNDCAYPMEEAVRDAIALGLDEICFTEHVDYGILTDAEDTKEIRYRAGGPNDPLQMPMLNVDYPRYIAQVQRMRGEYGNRIEIRTGLEYGVQTHTMPQYRRLAQRYPMDFVILSIHQIGDLEFWNGEYMEGKTQDEYIAGYYDEMLATAEAFTDYSVLGHIGMIERYDANGPYPFEKIKPVMEQILRRVISDGKGIEVNTSCFRYNLRDITPAVPVLRLYRQLGGRILTLGSDTHKKEHLGAHMAKVRGMLRDMGFEEFCTYRAMEPVFHRL